MASHRIVISGKEYVVVEVGARSGSTVAVTVNGRQYTVEVQPGAAVGRAGTKTPPPHVSAPRGGDLSGEVRAPISGVVLNVPVAAGQAVKAGSLVVVLEAMKMENEIFAPIDGTVEAVLVKAQQEVRQGDMLVQIKA